MPPPVPREMSATTFTTLSSSLASLALTPSTTATTTTQHDQQGASVSAASTSVPNPTSAPHPAASAPTAAGSSINPLNEYHSPNTRQMATLAVSSPLLLPTSFLATTPTTCSPPSPTPVPATRSSRRRHRTASEEQSPPFSRAPVVSSAGSSGSSGDRDSRDSEPLDSLTADLCLLNTLDTQQPAKRAHTDAPHDQPNSPAPAAAFIHPLKPKLIKRRMSRATAACDSLSQPRLQQQQQRCKDVAAAQLAVDELLYDGGGGESEAEWEEEHGSELRFLLDSLHVAKDAQAGCMPYIL